MSFHSDYLQYQETRYYMILESVHSAARDFTQPSTYHEVTDKEPFDSSILSLFLKFVL